MTGGASDSAMGSPRLLQHDLRGYIYLTLPWASSFFPNPRKRACLYPTGDPGPIQGVQEVLEDPGPEELVPVGRGRSFSPA